LHSKGLIHTRHILCDNCVGRVIYYIKNIRLIKPRECQIYATPRQTCITALDVETLSAVASIAVGGLVTRSLDAFRYKSSASRSSDGLRVIDGTTVALVQQRTSSAQLRTHSACRSLHHAISVISTPRTARCSRSTDIRINRQILISSTVLRPGMWQQNTVGATADDWSRTSVNYTVRGLVTM